MKRFIISTYKVFLREFKLVTKDMGIILFLVFLPLAYPIIYSLIYNPEVVRDVKMIVVDNDRSALSRELVRNLDATQEIWIKGYAADMNEARHAMSDHKCYGILEIPADFGRKCNSGEVGNAVIYSEMSLLLRYRGFLVASTNVSQAMGAEIQHADINRSLPLAETIATGDPMPVANISMGNIESGFDSFIMPGIVILILQQCIILAIGMAGGARHESPLITGYDSYNESTSVVGSLIGKVLAYFTIMIVPAIFLIHYVPLIFSFPMAGNIGEEFLFIIPLILSSIFLAFSLQGFVRERESIFVLWVVTSVFFLFLSGLTWPRYAMSPFWKFLSDLVPATWGVEGFIRMNTNGASLAQVSADYTSLWWLTLLYAITAYCSQRWIMRPLQFRLKKAA